VVDDFLEASMGIAESWRLSEVNSNSRSPRIFLTDILAEVDCVLLFTSACDHLCHVVGRYVRYEYYSEEVRKKASGEVDDCLIFSCLALPVVLRLNTTSVGCDSDIYPVP
jgi:hypothetical protein